MRTSQGLKQLTVEVAGTDFAAPPWEENRFITSRFGALVLNVAAVHLGGYSPLLLDLQEDTIITLHTHTHNTCCAYPLGNPAQYRSTTGCNMAVERSRQDTGFRMYYGWFSRQPRVVLASTSPSSYCCRLSEHLMTRMIRPVCLVICFIMITGICNRPNYLNCC
jgi:hypothetical protein